jgi:hypothetical protein
MKYKFHIFLFFFIIANLISCSKKNIIKQNNTLTKQYESLTITISTEKEVYIKGESVWVKLVFKNTGTADYKFRSKDMSTLLISKLIKLYLIDSDNRRYNYSGFIWDGVWTDNFSLLKPGEEFQQYYNISENFGTPFWEGRGGGLNYFEPKYYSFFIVLHSKVISNQIMFKVIKPKDEIKKEFELFKNAFNTQSYSEKKQIYRKIIDKFPESPYAENALYLSTIGFITQGENEYRKIVDLSFEFIDKFRESHYLRRVIRQIPSVHFSFKEYDKIESSYQKIVNLYEGSNPNIVKIASEVFEYYENRKNE